ncbi:hypothetical protein FIM03_02565 [SAR202 cluster bacterium AD-802-L14_MRT_200m]|nr:hypothetical protein [SAR202 cluster bacterium AD-802-L14_MRT_200m]
MAQFYFEREVRTPNGECYTILEDSKAIGRLDLHFVPGLVHATMVVNESLTQEAVQELISMVDEDLTDAVGIEREDLVVHVHQGRDLGVFSHNDSTLHEAEGDTTPPTTGA